MLNICELSGQHNTELNAITDKGQFADFPVVLSLYYKGRGEQHKIGIGFHLAASEPGQVNGRDAITGRYVLDVCRIAAYCQITEVLRAVDRQKACPEGTDEIIKFSRCKHIIFFLIHIFLPKSILMDNNPKPS